MFKFTHTFTATTIHGETNFLKFKLPNKNSGFIITQCNLSLTHPSIIRELPKKSLGSHRNQTLLTTTTWCYYRNHCWTICCWLPKHE